MGILEKINHQLLGTGPRRIVFLHGLAGSGNNWSRTTSQFSKDAWTILTYDQRGHGRSFKPQTGYRSEDYAGDLLGILNELNWPQIDLVGHSMGGRVALTFASQNPDRLRSLTVEDISVGPAQTAVSKIETWIESVPVPFAEKKLAKDYLFGEFRSHFSNETEHRNIANFFYANLEEKAPGVIEWRFFKPGILESLREGRTLDRSPQWAGLKIPTLIIRGENSQDLSPEEYLRMCSLLPSCKGVVVPNAGHWVHSDQPKTFFEELNTFLNSF